MRAFLVLSTLALSGCVTDSLYFGSYTRVGIDVSSDGAGIGAKNVALNVTPPKKDGTTFDVVGTSDLDIAYTDVVIKEVVAVGDAAICAASKTKLNNTIKLLEETAATKPAIGPVIFGTYTSWSLLDISWSDATATGINFGYKRGVGIRLPIVNDTVGPVYASITVNTSDGETVAPKSNITGTRNKYVFATGKAAIIKASQEAPALNGMDSSYVGCLQ